jgi:soluble cytochrome b562
VLDEHRKNCEREGKFDEAQQARKRLKELRILEEQKRRVDTD